MNRTLTMLMASALAMTSMLASAQEQVPDKTARDAETLKYQDAMIKATQDPQGRNVSITRSAAEARAANAKRDAGMAQMTPDQRSAARKAHDVEALNYQDAMDKATQDPQRRNAGIAKSAAESRAGPTPPHGTMNTPQADKVLREQKGQ